MKANSGFLDLQDDRFANHPDCARNDRLLPGISLCAGDPSLRLKNGSARDDAESGTVVKAKDDAGSGTVVKAKDDAGSGTVARRGMTPGA